MSDSVHFHLEQMLPELRDLEERGIFNRTEIKAIVKKRTALEYAIHRRISLKADYLKYIEYELNLEQLRRKRKERLGIDKDNNTPTNTPAATPAPSSKGSVSDYSILKRIHALYSKALKKFGGKDVDLWVQYFEWCKELGSSKALNSMLARAIQVHPTNPIFWIMSSNWEFETNSNVTSARILLQRALRLNPESERLWLEYFGLELKFVEKVKQRRRILLGHQEEDAMVPTKSAVTSTTVKADHEDSTEDHIIDGIDLPELEEEKGLVKSDLEKEKLILNQNNEGGENDDDAKLAASNKIIAELAIPRVVYKQAIKAIPSNLQFRLDFLKFYISNSDGNPQATEIGRNEVYESILSDFPESAEARAAVCIRHLVIAQKGPSDPAYPMALKESITEFMHHTVYLSTPEMWEQVLKFALCELDKVDERHLTLYLESVVDQIFKHADLKKLASPSFYMSYIQFIQKSSSASSSDSSILETYKRATMIHPSSLDLWKNYLETIMAKEEETIKEGGVATFDAVFESALHALDQSSEECRFSVWSIKADIVVRKFNNGLLDGDQVDEQFAIILQKSLLPKQLESRLFIVYLTWVLATSSSSLDRFRQCYQLFISAKPVSIDFLMYCIQVEKSHSNINLKAIEGLYESACAADADNQDMWLGYIKLLVQLGQIDKAAQIHWKASKRIEDFATLASITAD